MAIVEFVECSAVDCQLVSRVTFVKISLFPLLRCALSMTTLSLVVVDPMQVNEQQGEVLNRIWTVLTAQFMKAIAISQWH